MQHTLLNRDEKAGVSLIHLSKRKFDAGNIVLQKEIDIDSTSTYVDLRDSLGVLGGELAADIVLGDTEDLNRKSITQDIEKMTSANLFEGDTFNQFNFKSKNAEDNLRIFNAFIGSSTEPFTEIFIKKENRKALFDDLAIADPSNENDKRAIERFESIGTELGDFTWHRKLNKSEIYIKCLNSTYLKFSSIRIGGFGRFPSSRLMSFQIGKS